MYFFQNEVLLVVFSTFGSSSQEIIINWNKPMTIGKRTHVAVASDIIPTNKGITAPPEDPIDVMISKDCVRIFLGKIFG